MERSFAAEVKHLAMGAGQVLRGELSAHGR
jgi:hypothetical protein